VNLVSNAIKYSDPLKPESFVEIAPVAADEPNPNRCTIAIRDNGLGIPESDQAAIFERFFRAHAHLDEDLGITGSGLGLAIVADCVPALDGSIRCESAAGEGTTFYLTLPCEPVAV
jgi:signal transduction histidine kinase